MNNFMAVFSRKGACAIARFSELIYGMMDSLIRNSDAFVWLVRVRKIEDKYQLYYYLLRIACWAVIFGRHIGLSKVDLR